MVPVQVRDDAFSDPFLRQAELILDQRKSRKLVLDREIFGEPGWDILLCAFIARRKGLDCVLEEVAADIDATLSLTRRWVNVLVEKSMLFYRDERFTITPVVESRLATMFNLQLERAFNDFGLVRT